MIDDLSAYLKSKGSVEAIEQQEKQVQKLAVENVDLKANESKLTEQMNDLQKQYDILLEQNVKAEEVNQRITREYGKANVEIRDLEERLEKSKNEIQKVLKCQALERENFESQLEQKSESFKQIEKQMAD